MAIVRSNNQETHTSETVAPRMGVNGRARLTDSSQVEEVKGYLNIRMKDSNGDYHNIRANIPLYESNRIHKGILNKANAEPEATMEIIATVNLLSNEVPTF